MLANTHRPRMIHDLRDAVRRLFLRPSFTIVAIITLALGVGANTAIFSAVSALLLRPLPVPDADRVVQGVALREGFDPFGTSLLEYAAYRDGSHSLAASGVALSQSFTIAANDEPERVDGVQLTAGYLTALAIQPIAGRPLTADDERMDAPQVALIGYDLWQRRFGGLPTAVGSQLTLDSGVHTIVGIMPRGFDLPSGVELWTPLRVVIDTLPLRQRASTSYRMVARLAPGVSLDAADRDLKAIAKRLEAEYPEYRRGWTYRVVPLRQYLLGDLAGRNRLALFTLSAAVACLLLICCANVANLLLVRGIAREREIAVRLAIGASRLRVARQLLIESVVLALAGGVAGVLLATWMAPVLASLNPIPAEAFDGLLRDFHLDRGVLTFGLGLSVLTGLAFGTLPALRAARVGDIAAVLKSREQRTAGGANRWLGALVTVEVAIAVVLLVNGSLIVQTFSRLQRIDLGFEPDRLLTLQLTLPAQKYAAHADRVAFVDRLVNGVRQVPGVESAGVSTNVPLTRNSFDSVFTVEGRPPVDPADVPITAHRLVTPDYLQTLGVRLTSGRFLNEDDRATGRAVVIVTEELARQAWPGEDPLGKRIRRGRAADTSFPWMTVVGVVADVKEDRFNFRIDRPAWYIPYSQVDAGAPINLLVRSHGDPAAVAAGVRATIRAIDSQQAISRMQSVNEGLSDLLVTERFSAVLMTALASLGLFLAVFGLYGVIAYSASQRSGEIGLRIALGADRGAVLRLVMKQGLAFVAAGIVLGSAVARVLSVALSTMLFGVNANDVATFVAVGVLLAGVSLVACYMPARRASRVDPVTALRAD